jgi:hypothetical protein
MIGAHINWRPAMCLCLVTIIAPADPPLNLGPYNVTALEGGIGIVRPLGARSLMSAATAPWSMTGWIRWTRRQSGELVVAAVGAGAPAGDGWRGIFLADGELRAAIAPGVMLRGSTDLQPGRWTQVAVTYDGAVARLYVDGMERSAQRASTKTVSPRIELAPPGIPASGSTGGHFGGSVALFTFTAFTQSAAQIQALANARPDFSLITFDALGVGWPLQEHAWRGLQEPQDPWTLPHGNSPPSVALAGPAPTASLALRAKGAAVSGVENWHLIAAPAIDATGEQLSQPHYQERDWYPAVVPGTVLTTLIARGVYPDPDYGLNNLAIPDSLSRQDYWYRSVFSAPRSFRDRDLLLVFKGINYAAQVWLNGRRLGSIRGAFTRGRFDVTGILRPGESNAIAVRVAPPPHPGIPHEQSIAAGPGNNGGAMAIDGPTFIASEGWDWIPGIRDRNTGIWQDVEIRATGALRLGDPHVVSHLPLPRTDTADITIAVPVDNTRATVVPGRVVARFDGISVEKTVSFNPGTTEVTFNPAEFQQLHLAAPRLWWPNGYGAPNLHTMQIEVETGRAVSDSASIRFGIRELTYELSLFDREGRLRRVEVDPTLGSIRGERLIDVRHEAIKRTPDGWAESLTPAGEDTPAVRPSSSESLTPYLVIRVNGGSHAGGSNPIFACTAMRTSTSSATGSARIPKTFFTTSPTNMVF